MTNAKKEFQPGRGYTKQDWDAVDSPELTDEQIAAGGKPFAEVFPELAESIKRSRGRPKLSNAKQAVTLRLDPSTLAKFQAAGDDWRSRMAEVLDKAKVGGR